MPFFMELCFCGMSEMRMQATLEIFKSGKDSKGMLFVAGGTLEYYFEDEEESVQELREFDWACEAVLWVRWCHRGRMVTTKDCDLMWLSSATFRDIAARNMALSFLKRYALRFVANLNQAEQNGEVYDVWKFGTVDNDNGLETGDPLDAGVNEAVYKRQREEQRSLARKSVQLAQADNMNVTKSDLSLGDGVAAIADVDDDEEEIDIMPI